MYILGIETSCDESAAAIIKGDKENIIVLSNIISSQINIHSKYGGVIPEVAAREHAINLIPTIDKALKKANISLEKIDALSVTIGPGLISSLLSGIETVRVLSYIYKKNIIPVNHLAGHIYANFINRRRIISFPLLSLIVSGGHTLLVYMKNHYDFKVIGETRDDAAGEAYDKGAKMLGLSYPGGPIIAKLAQKAKDKKSSNIVFPQPMVNSNNLDFSFSGLKTSLLYKIKEEKKLKEKINEYCFKYQEAINNTLVKKTIKAINKYKVKTFLLAGGVSANTDLKERFKNHLNKDISFFYPNIQYTTDNAAMIASAAYFNYYKNKEKSFKDKFKIKADINIKL